MKDLNICKKCDYLALEETKEPCCRCDKAEVRKVTNGDRIRGMSDEELAKFIRKGINLEWDIYCSNMDRCVKSLDTDDDIPEEWCEECFIRWLESEEE